MIQKEKYCTLTLFFLLSRCLVIKLLEDEANTNKIILNLRAYFRLKSKNYFESILLFILIHRSPFSFILKCKLCRLEIPC